MSARSRLLVCVTALCTLAFPTLSRAQSNLAFYGVVDNGMAYSSSQTTLGSTANGRRNLFVAPGTWEGSKFGIQGREELGGGFATSFNLMSRFNSANGNAQFTNALFGQQAWVSLSHRSYGSLTLGRQLTSYYWMISANSPTKWLTGFAGAHPGDLDNFDTLYKTSNTVLYTTPTYNGLTASASYALGGAPGSISTGASWSSGVQYKNGAFGIGAGLERFNNATLGGGTWGASSSASSGGQQGISAVTNGYQTAAAQQRFAVTTGYAFSPNIDLSASYSNVQYIPGANSAFRSTAVWNTLGAVAHLHAATVWDFAAGYSFTRAYQANGISNNAEYQQVSLAEYYSLSKQTGFYLLQAYQRAGGQTLGSNGIAIIAATATIGDGFNSTPAASRSMATIAVGVIHRF